MAQISTKSMPKTLHSQLLENYQFLFKTFNTLKANSADDKIIDIFLFSQKTDFDNSSTVETICMKYQNLLSEKNKKSVWKCHLLIFFTQHATGKC